MRISDWSSDVCSSDLRDYPAVRGMILATGLSDEQMVRLRSAGFNPVREDIDALGLGYVRLQTPDDKGLAQSIRQARKIAPNAAIGSNPIYFQSGPTTRGRDRKSTRLNSSH